MKIQQIEEYKTVFDNITKQIRDDNGNTIEVWYARDLQNVLGCSQWRNFLTVINKAIISCKMQQINTDNHCANVSKMVDLGSDS